MNRPQTFPAGLNIGRLALGIFRARVSSAGVVGAITLGKRRLVVLCLELDSCGLAMTLVLILTMS